MNAKRARLRACCRVAFRTRRIFSRTLFLGGILLIYETDSICSSIIFALYASKPVDGLGLGIFGGGGDAEVVGGGFKTHVPERKRKTILVAVISFCFLSRVVGGVLCVIYTNACGKRTFAP